MSAGPAGVLEEVARGRGVSSATVLEALDPGQALRLEGDGETMFEVFVGRDAERRLVPDELARFEGLGAEDHGRDSRRRRAGGRLSAIRPPWAAGAPTRAGPHRREA